jgi:hypothetical protein
MADFPVAHAEDLVYDSKLYPLRYQCVAHARRLYKPGVEQPLGQKLEIRVIRPIA